MTKTAAQWKAEMKAAGAGLAGAEKKAAEKAFYDANKAAIQTARDEIANAVQAPQAAAEAAIKAAAAVKGLQASIMANTGYVRGSSYDTVVLVSGNTFNCKEALKAHGAKWNAAGKAWVFASEAEFLAAMAAI